MGGAGADDVDGADDAAALDAARTRLTRWLFEAALPLWWRAGADHARGGFHDKLAMDGTAVDLPKRVRVLARQIFVFAEAGRLGWDGPWRAAVDHGIAFLPAYERPDGRYRASVNDAGEPVAEAPDLYDQAFVIFALAAAYRASGRPAALRERALALLGRLDALLRHPVAGYEEANPRRLPLRSNPHMHLLEALLAWVAAGERGPFEARAHEIVALARERLIDPATGAIGEYYDGDWAFAAGPEGALREPGHQFEWAYLLDLAERLIGGDHREAILKLERFGSVHGVRGGLALFSLDAGGAIVDGSSRLWAQSERLRTMLVLAPRLDPPAQAAARAAAAESAATLERFLDAPTRGLWHERVDGGGRWIDEPVPASSLYHIVTGIVPLIER